MLHLSPYIQDFMARYRYPAEAVSLFTEVERRLDAEPEHGALFDRHLSAFMLDRTEELGDAL
ncbi:MAG: hypothetical protein II747_01230, partial [Clostridia bacterium]|nr:hypothetical protein [Clostridia bacterium]